MPSMYQLLDVEYEEAGARTLASLLGEEYAVLHCRDPEDSIAQARSGRMDLLLLDLDLPGSHGFALLDELSRIPRGPPVIARSAQCASRVVVRAMKCGAVDFLESCSTGEQIKSAIRKCRSCRPSQEESLKGSSGAMKRVLRLLERYAASDFPVLIHGESGTGKELAAKRIHELSRRAEKPFVAINCAAIPMELIESELFGACRGGFTGAEDRAGAFETADGGTLFLDEIGDAGPQVQVKLLRALESGEIKRIGGRTIRRVDIRFLAATSRDLRRESASGCFRSDLLYRIETLPLVMPPLRERKEDIPELVQHLLWEAGGGMKRFSHDALDALMQDDWPGNVRQLKNMVCRGIVLSGSRELIHRDDIYS